LLIIGQNIFSQELSYKETVIENPTAEEDLKLVSDYINALTANKMEVAASYLADTYIGRGPAHEETETKAENIATWKEAHKVRTNQKNDFVINTFRVTEGDLKGDWVSVWGTYTYTQDNIITNLPYQFTALVADGKIETSMIYYERLAVYEGMGYELTKKE
jgi:hypothetical protein